MRRLLVLVLAGAIGLLAVGTGTGLAGHANALTRQRQELAQRATAQSQVLNDYFERSRSITLITAQNPAFAEFYDLPGSHDDRIRSGGALLKQADDAMDYLEKLYPESIGEACFIDAGGGENARVVRGDRAAVDDLSPDESGNPFFHPTFALTQGQVYQAKPYVSPDTNEWVLANSTAVPSRDGINHAIVHFEVTVESFRREAAAHGSGGLLVVDADTGAVVLDTAVPQRVGAPAGQPDGPAVHQSGPPLEGLRSAEHRRPAGRLPAGGRHPGQRQPLVRHRVGAASDDAVHRRGRPGGRPGGGFAAAHRLRRGGVAAGTADARARGQYRPAHRAAQPAPADRGPQGRAAPGERGRSAAAHPV